MRKKPISSTSITIKICFIAFGKSSCTQVVFKIYFSLIINRIMFLMGLTLNVLLYTSGDVTFVSLNLCHRLVRSHLFSPMLGGFSVPYLCNFMVAFLNKSSD